MCLYESVSLGQRRADMTRLSKMAPGCSKISFSNSLLKTEALEKFSVPALLRLSGALHLQIGHQSLYHEHQSQWQKK